MEYDSIRAVEWTDAGLRMLDQRHLPGRCEFLVLREAAAVAQAIGDMVVRGAPAIGITAAYGVVLAAAARRRQDAAGWQGLMERDLVTLAAARPTAVNLSWALARMRRAITAMPAGADPVAHLLAEARRIHAEDVAANRRMGELGAALIEEPCGVLTHCNTGSLATGGYGTALGMIRSAWSAGRFTAVYAGETRPWLQGARLTAWELVLDNIPVTLIADSAAAALMRRGEVGCVVVGADRVARNGDVANKIGTYGLAVLARHHGVKFVVVAPTSTVDMAVNTGADIPIETRAVRELLSLTDVAVAAAGAGAWNPVFDVTPAALVDALVTERGVVHQPNAARLEKLMADGGTHQ